MKGVYNRLDYNKLKKFTKYKMSSQFGSYFSSRDSNDLSDILPDHLTYNIPKYNKNPNEFDFPWLMSGAPFLELKARFLPEQIFVRSKTPKAELLKHLFKIYRGVLLACSENDQEFLKEYVEPIFCDRLIKKLEEFKTRKYTLEVVEDMKANNGVRLFPEMHMYDCVVIKGLFLDRNRNGKETEHSVCNDIEEMGFVSYIPAYLSDPNNFKTKEMAEEKLQQGEFRNVIFRSYCMFKSGLKTLFYDRFGNKIIDYPDIYNYNHACVFECLMIPPPPFKSFSEAETYTEWVAKHKFGVWRMIDMDNWMKGNPYFIKKD
jgi:hypothetical protein